MINLNLLGGVKAKMYMSIRELRPRHDNTIDDTNVDLPTFISQLTKEEIDSEYEARRKRKEEIYHASWLDRDHKELISVTN